MRVNGVLEGIAVGAVAMYFFDPARGRARRAMLRDRTRKRLRQVQRDLTIIREDFTHRFTGSVAEAKHAFNHNHVSNEVLAERIRSQLGRRTSHVGAIMIDVHDGAVHLSGDVLADDVNDVMRCVRQVASHMRIDNGLHVHERKEHFPGLQGRERSPVPNPRWTPGMSLAMSCLGTGMFLAGALRRGFPGGLLIAVGSGMIAKGFSDVEHRNDPTNGLRIKPPRHRIAGRKAALSG